MVATKAHSPRSAFRKVADNQQEDLGVSLSSLRLTDPKVATERLQDSIKSLLSLESDDEEDNIGTVVEEYASCSSGIGARGDMKHSSMFSMLEHQEMNVRHVDLIRSTWDAFKSTSRNETKNHTKAGEEIINKMIQLEGSSEASLGISSTYPTRKENLCGIVVDSLDHIIFQVMGRTLNEVELDCKAQDWLDEGLDAMLLHRALIKCLEEKSTANKNAFTDDDMEAWKTTFGDVLHKMTYAF